MTLRPAAPADLEGIMAIEHRSFPTDAWSPETMAAELASPHGRYLVDEEDGVLVGYGGVRALQGGEDADIQTIALDAAFRGTGRGRALLRALLAEASARGAREVFLEVRADNPVAEGLYLAEGFEELARRPRYYQPDDVDAIVMRLDLKRRSAVPRREEFSPLGGGSRQEAPPDAEKSAHRGAAERTDPAAVAASTATASAVGTGTTKGATA